MKKQILIGLISISSILTLNAQWNTNGNDIYNTNSGSIGIGGSPITNRRVMIWGHDNSASGIALDVKNLSGEDILSCNNDASVNIGYYSALNILRNGNIGIGISDPGKKLDVDGDIRVKSGHGFEFIRNGNAYGYSIWSNEGGHFCLGQGPSSNLRQNIHFFIDANTANVGIGTTTPSYALSIYKESLNADILLTTNISSGQAGLWFRVNPTGKDGGIIYQSDGRLSFNLDNEDAGYVENNEYLTIKPSGRIGIGVVDPQTKLHVNGDLRVDGEIFHRGTLKSKQIKVEMPTGDWKDIVFDKGYKLMALPEVERFINQNKHLPSIPSASEVEKAGLDIGQFQASLLQKIEELTLYTIEQNKRLESVEEQNKLLKQEIELLKNSKK